MMSYPQSRLPSYMATDQYSGFYPPAQSQPQPRQQQPRGRPSFGNSVHSAPVADPGFNTSDPALLFARVFVGNLDTGKVTREQILQKYSSLGSILGLTVFKGYAFVQYGSYEEAIHAVGATNKTMLAGQALDVKLVSESQGQSRAPAQKHKQQNFYGGNAPQAKKQRNDTGPIGGGGNRQLLNVPTAKKQMSAPLAVFKKQNQQPQQQQPAAVVIEDDTKREDLHSYEFKDTLICGNCRTVFTDWFAFRDHRKSPCSALGRKPEDEPDQLLCFVCKESFNHSWHLLLHLGEMHHLHVYTQEGQQNGDAKTNVEDVKKEMQNSQPTV